MIHHLEGTLVEKGPKRLIVEVGGVGFELLVSSETWNDTGLLGSRVRLLTHLAVREDSWTLFGFASEEERELFRLLLGVQGVGPKLALGVLSGLSVESLRRAVGSGDVDALTAISGVGKKTASRIVVDLRDKVGALPGVRPHPAEEGSDALSPVRDDAVDALVSLGYPRSVAREAVRGARAGENESVEEVLKGALRRL
jgi:Holliday junction DNA helicase RuvA